jgi:hypothetical protein
LFGFGFKPWPTTSGPLWVRSWCSTYVNS